MIKYVDIVSQNYIFKGKMQFYNYFKLIITAS